MYVYSPSRQHKVERTDTDRRQTICIHKPVTDRRKQTQLQHNTQQPYTIRNDYITLPALESIKRTRCSAIAERLRCRMRYSFGQKWKTRTGRQYFTDIIGLSSTTVI